MTELKLYRKIKERERQQWKDELREKIYKKQYDYYLRKQKNVAEPKVDAKPFKKQPEKQKDDKMNKKKTIEIIVDASRPKSKSVGESEKKQVSIAAVSIKPPVRRSCSKSKENIPCRRTADNRPASAPEPLKNAETRQSRRRTRSVTHADKEPLIEIFPRSKSCKLS